ncbi:MAG: pyridoxamine 5'-phosphate oxidase family protein [Terracidiphilus sp.]
MDALDAIRALLAAESTLALATAGEDGHAHSTPLFYLAGEQFRLYWFSSPRSAHSGNCLRDPLVSVSVYRPTDDWRRILGVEMRGSVRLVPSGPERKSVAGRYAERFQLNPALRLALRASSLYCFTPRWVRLVDNAKGFAARCELELPAQQGAP